MAVSCVVLLGEGGPFLVCCPVCVAVPYVVLYVCCPVCVTVLYVHWVVCEDVCRPPCVRARVCTLVFTLYALA